MEIWGRCGRCDRWFYCPTAPVRDRSWVCPMCGREPTAIENRAPGAAGGADSRGVVLTAAPGMRWTPRAF